MSTERSLTEYYARRAAEYEAIYHRDDPVRQREQAELAEALRRVLAGRRVLEVACGTGYWTASAAASAAHIVATDAAAETLAIARAKRIPRGRVEFRVADAYDLAAVPGTFDGGLANFWLSHVPRARLDEFLDGFHARLEPGAAVFLADNVYVDGVGGELQREDGGENTFKRRTLADGSERIVLKNYYDESELRELLGPRARGLQAHWGACFWWVSYATR